MLRTLALALAVAAAPGAASAQGLTARAEPGYTSSTTVIRDGAGNETRTSASVFTQRYRAGLALDPYPLLRFDLNGNYEWLLGSTTLDGVRSTLDSTTWSGDARLSLGNPTLSGGVAYTRQEQGSSTGSNGQIFRLPTTIREAYVGFVGWRPAELPALDLRASRTTSYDTARRSADNVVDELGASARYEPSRTTDLRYNVHFTDATDRLRRTETREITNAASASWSDRLLENRLTSSASYNIQTRTSRTLSSGGAAFIATLQPALRGLSTVEPFPTPDRISLVDKDNPALVDGNTAPTSAATGIDLGFGPALGGDTAGRELGLQFPGPNIPVNLLYVWVDRALPPEVAAFFQFDVYRSSDGNTWTRVDVAAPLSGGPAVQFSLFDNRFEVAFATVEAPYLKVVTRPLGPGATTDAQFTNIRVTELQALNVVPAAQAARDTTQTSGNLSAAAKYLITRGGPNLSYDVSAFLAHSEGTSRFAYSVVNGLSAGRRVWRIAELTGRLERADSGASGTAHEAVNRGTVSLLAEILPTLAAGVVYTGQVSQRATGTGLINGVSAIARADLYQGVNVSGNAAFNFGFNELDQTLRSTVLSTALSLVPNKALSMTAGYSYTSSSTTGGGRPEQVDRLGRVDGSLAFTPFPALSLSGSASRYVQGRPPNTLLSFAGGFSPFPGGDLALRFSYTETREEESSSRFRAWGPGIRWKIRPGTYADAAYTVSDGKVATVDTSTKAFIANLVITLR